MIFYSIIVFLIVIVFFLFNITSIFTAIKSKTFEPNLFMSLSYFFLFIILFTLQWGYYIFFEMLFNGKSIGKMILGLRVIMYDGEFLDFSSSVLRNFIRVIDINITFYWGAILSMMINKDLRRIGDLVANTIVIKEQKFKINIPDFSIYDLKDTDILKKKIIKKLSENDLYVIRRFLNTADSFKTDKKIEIANKIALAIKNKLNDTEEINDPIEYLKKIYLGHQDE